MASSMCPFRVRDWFENNRTRPLRCAEVYSLRRDNDPVYRHFTRTSIVRRD